MGADESPEDTTGIITMMDESESGRGNEKRRPTLLMPFEASPKQKPNLSAFIISSDGTLESAEVQNVLKTETIDGEVDAEKALPPVVLDVDINDAGDLAALREQVLDTLHLPALLQRHLTMKQIQTPQVLALNRAVLVVIRVLPAMYDLSAQMKNVYYSAALCVENGTLLLMNIMPKTEEEESNSKKQARSRQLEKDAVSVMCRQELPSASISGALLVWLSFHLGQVTTATQKLRTHMFELAENMDEDIHSVDISEITEAKDRFLRLFGVAEEQDECMQSLTSGETISRALDFEKLKGYVSVLLSAAGSNDRMANRLEKRVDDLRQTYDAHQQNRINRRLAVLTIVSAIFLPLTLMAGIWGMNFSNMPGLQKQNGYFFALGSMALVAAILLLGFQRFGWLL